MGNELIFFEFVFFMYVVMSGESVNVEFINYLGVSRLPTTWFETRI